MIRIVETTPVVGSKKRFDDKHTNGLTVGELVVKEIEEQHHPVFECGIKMKVRRKMSRLYHRLYHGLYHGLYLKE